MRILSAVSCTSCWASLWAQVLLGARTHVPHWQRVWKHHGWFLMWDMTWCNNANSSRYSQSDSVCKYCELGQCVACTVWMMEQWRKKLSIWVRSLWWHVTWLRWLHGALWAGEPWTQLPLISRPGPAAQKRKRLARAGQRVAPVSQSMSTLGCERNLTIRCNYQIWHPSPDGAVLCCHYMPLHPLYCVVHIWTINHVLCGSWRAN